jgi:hypothetical protein
MKKVALALVPALSLTGKATAQEARYGTEVCVNASLVDEAKRLFPILFMSCRTLLFAG